MKAAALLAEALAGQDAMLGERIKQLQEMPIFGGVRRDILTYLLELAPSVKKIKGDYFCRENEDADSLFVLERGKVAVLKAWKGEQCLLNKLGAGDCFGEMAVIDLGRRTSSVLALEDSSAIQVSAGNLYAVYKRDLEQFTIIQMNLCREISRRLRLADERLFASKHPAQMIAGEYVFPPTLGN
ncbi:MAG: cyclic nucleotide-binding domain-containing protein [Gammaproteobacteria bacterium]